MSKHETKQVEFFIDGKLVQTDVDPETARAISKYKDVYNCVQSFEIATCNVPARRDGFIREAVQATSRKLKIVCTKEYNPNIPETVAPPRYECGILNTKSQQFEAFSGVVPMLYYKLFSGRIK